MPISVSYDKSFFKHWSHESAYVLGFFCADGNMIRTKRGTHYVAWYSSDESLIRSIRRTLKSRHKISSKHSGRGVCYCLQIGSKELFRDLSAHGIFPGKAMRMKLPHVPALYVGHFIRGYFDGDGNVWMGYIHQHRATCNPTLQVTFTSGSYDFLHSLLQLLRSLGITGGSVYRSRVGNFSRLMLSVRDALLIYKIMYTTEHKLFLKRKKDVFEKFVAFKQTLRA
jgi:intein/homing endonuclease